jgi:hypothetical protein
MSQMRKSHKGRFPKRSGLFFKEIKIHLTSEEERYVIKHNTGDGKIIGSSAASVAEELLFQAQGLKAAVHIPVVAIGGIKGWFEASSCKPTSSDLPSSLVQPRGALTV